MKSDNISKVRMIVTGIGICFITPSNNGFNT